MNEDEQGEAVDVELRACGIRVAARGDRWFKHLDPEYHELAQNLREIILLQVAGNKSLFFFASS